MLSKHEWKFPGSVWKPNPLIPDIAWGGGSGVPQRDASTPGAAGVHTTLATGTNCRVGDMRCSLRTWARAYFRVQEVGSGE